MSDRDDQSDSAPADGDISRGDSVSTLVAPADAILGPSLSGASSSGGSHPEMALPTDKTVISKRAASTDSPPPLPASSQSLGAALVGKKFGNYELVEFVGGGGMGAVFRATDTSMGRTVAVKVLSRDQTDEETIRRFRNEAQSAARLDHPNIARAYYVGEHEGWNYIVFEYVQGTNLRDLVEKQGPLPIEQALNYTLQVAQALEHAAGRDVVHRDIKPSNVLVTPAGEIKLVDMGLARLHQVESSSDDLTASGVTLGTFDYISPEQARDPRMADSRSDIYSLGCTLYFMLAGRPPFPDGTALQKLLWHSGEDPPDPRLFRPDLPTQVIRLLEKMLAKRPSQRPQSPRELIGEIVLAADEMGLAGFGKGQLAVFPVAAGPSAWSRAASILIPIAALVLLIMLVDAWRPAEDNSRLSLRPKLRGPAPAVAKIGEKTGEKTSEPSTVPKAASPVTESPGAAATAVPEMPVSPEPPIIEPASTPVVKNGPPSPGIAESSPTPAESPAKTADGNAGLAAAPVESANLTALPAESASLAAGALPATVAAKAKITRLVLRPDGKPLSPLAPDQELVRSLARAVQRAAELGVQDIELQFTGVILEQPLELGASRLNIRAASGMKPVVLFRPELKGSESDKQMIRLKCGTSGKISLQGIEFRMELPAESSYGWSLFAIYQTQALDLSECVLTVKDAGPGGLPAHYDVAFFALQPRRVGDAMKMMDDEMKMMGAMGLNLNRCVARGNATFLIAAEESPFQLVWKQGLLVSTGRLIETGGSPFKPTEFGRLDIDLDHVTAIIPQGLYSMKRRSANAYQLKADIRCRNSLLQTKSDAPLFEFSDLATVDDIKLNYGGEGNLYEREGIFLRFNPSTRGESTNDFPQSTRPRWSTEERSRVGILWQQPAADVPIPAYRQHPKKFLLSSDAPYQAGFDAGVLPEPSEPEEKPAGEAEEN